MSSGVGFEPEGTSGTHHIPNTSTYPRECLHIASLSLVVERIHSRRIVVVVSQRVGLMYSPMAHLLGGGGRPHRDFLRTERRMADNWRDKIALFLWRDRDGYDPATATVTEKHNISLWSRTRAGRKRLVALLLNGQLWLGILAGGFAVLAALLPGYMDRAKADKQVDADTRELRLNCVKQSDGVFLCRPIGRGQNEVVPGANAVDLNHLGASDSHRTKP